MKKFIPAIILSVIVYFTVQMIMKESKFSSYDKLPISELNKKLIYKISNQVPIKIDNILSIAKISSIDNKVLYEMKMNIKNNSFKDKWKMHKDEIIQTLKEQQIKTMCSQELTHYTIVQRNTILEYQYTDYKNNDLFNFSIAKQDCINIK
jgi:hypothetical protein